MCLLQEAVLQATQYIPDIVKLQKQMFDEFHHRIDHKVAHTTRMRDFIAKKHTGTFSDTLSDINSIHMS